MWLKFSLSWVDSMNTNLLTLPAYFSKRFTRSTLNDSHVNGFPYGRFFVCTLYYQLCTVDHTWNDRLLKMKTNICTLCNCTNTNLIIIKIVSKFKIIWNIFGLPLSRINIFISKFDSFLTMYLWNNFLQINGHLFCWWTEYVKNRSMWVLTLKFLNFLWVLLSSRLPVNPFFVWLISAFS